MSLPIYMCQKEKEEEKLGINKLQILQWNIFREQNERKNPKSKINNLFGGYYEL